MDKSELVGKFVSANAYVPGKRIKFDFGDQGVIYMDGVAQQITEEDAEADTTIGVSWDDFQALAGGTLNPMTAFMSGKIKVQGDMGGAMQLQSVMSKLAG